MYPPRKKDNLLLELYILNIESQFVVVDIFDC